MNQVTGKPNHISIITLNVNGLNSSIKRHRLTEWIKKKDPTIRCLQETHLVERDTHRPKVKGWGNNIPGTQTQQKSWSIHPHFR